MTFMKHITPGPVHTDCMLDDHPTDIFVTNRSGLPCATLGHAVHNWDEDRISWKNAEANASLWAEATNIATETGLSPRELADQNAELLAALEGLLHAATGFVNTARSENPALDPWPALDLAEKEANAAIAKAKGEAA